MTRTFVAAALAGAALCAAGQSPPNAGAGARATVYVAVERPVPVPDPVDARVHVPKVTPDLVAGWKIERGLGPSDFEVLVDDRGVSVVACHPAPTPAAVVLLVDATASMSAVTMGPVLRSPTGAAIIDLNDFSAPRPKATVDKVAQQVTRALIPALRPNDSLAVGRIAGGIEFTAFFTRDDDKLARAAAALLDPTSPDANRPFGLGASPIWDAVNRATGLLAPFPGPRAVVLVTDGRVSANVSTLSETIARALEAGVTVHVVSSSREETFQQGGSTAARVRPSRLLEPLASDTGGALLPAYGPRPVSTPFRNPWLRNDDDARWWLGYVLARMVEEVHASYALTFDMPTDGRPHRLTVRVKRPGLRVRAPVACRSAASPRGNW